MREHLSSLVKKLAVVAILFACSLRVFADGSRDMYPADYYTLHGITKTDITKYRAPIVAYEKIDAISGCPFPTNATMKVYAKEGEKIYVASSLFSTKHNANSKITYKAPDGVTSGTFTRNGNIGLIANRKAELAGPKLPNGQPSNGYQSCVITVGAGQTGVWEIEFNGNANYNYDDTKTATVDDWVDGSSCLMNAFDISVLNETGDAFIPGRVYTNVLNIYFTSATQKGYAEEWYSGFYVLTNTGYLYYVDANGQNPCLGTFFANNKGIQTGYGDFIQSSTSIKYAKGGKPSYNSVVWDTGSGLAKAGTIPIYDPRVPDNVVKKTDADGNLVDYYEDVTHKLFFTKPAADMPEFAPCVYDDQVVTTWLISKENAKNAPVLSNLCIAGKESHLACVLGPEGVEIYFDANCAGDFMIEMDFGEDYTPRILEGTCIEGANTIDWDGKDGDGNLVENAMISLAGKLKSAEIHFPFVDLDNNKHGLVLNQLNANWNEVARNIIYWNDSNVQTSKTTGDSEIASGESGVTSPNHNFSYTSTSDVSGKKTSRGDYAIIDTWTFAQGATASSQNAVVRSNFIDLKATSITCNKTEARIGELLTYTLEVENVHHDMIELQSEGVMVSTEADADSASVGVWFPDGGFYTTEVSLVSSDDPDCIVVQQPSGEEFGLGFINLKNGKKATIKVTGYAGAKMAHSLVEPVGFIMRPGDYFEIDAANLNNDGMPLIPQRTQSGDKDGEYDTYDNNNLTTANPVIFFLNSNPICSDDNVSGEAKVQITGNVFDNDNDPDNDLDSDPQVISDILIVEKFDVEGVGTNYTPGSSVTISNVGTVRLNQDGSFTFTSVGAFVGPVPAVTYYVSDQYTAAATPVEFRDKEIAPGRDTATIYIGIAYNFPPEVSPLAVTIEHKSAKTALPLTFSDIENNTIIISSLTGDDAENFEFTGTTVYYNGTVTREDAVYNITLTLTDDGDNAKTATYDIAVTVKKNNAPTVSSSPIDVTAVSAQTLVPYVFRDAENDPITVAVSGTDSDKFTVIDNKVYYIGALTHGKTTYNITLTLNDGYGEVTRDMVVNVFDNQEPVISPSVITIAKTGDETLVPFVIEDKDGDIVSITNISGTDASNFKIKTNKIFYIGDENLSRDDANNNITVTLSDGLISVSYDVVVVLGKNQAPILTTKYVEITGVASDVEVPLTFEDKENETVSITAINGDDVDKFSLVDGTIFYIGGVLDEPQVYTLSVVFTDGIALETDNINVSILVNKAPSVSPTAITIKRSGTETLVPISFSDPEDDALTISVNDVTNFKIKDGSLYYIGSNKTEDTPFNISLTLNDGINTTVQPVTVTVLGNNLPELSPSSVTITVKRTTSSTSTNNNVPVTISDPDGDEITSVTITSGNDKNYFTVSGTQIIFKSNKNNANTTTTNGTTYNLTIAIVSNGETTTLPLAVKVNVVSSLTTPTLTVTGSTQEYGTKISECYTFSAKTSSFSSTNVQGTASIVGYSDDYIPSVGMHTYTVLFTPNDLTTYATTTKTVNITINKKAITVTSASGSKEYDGTELKAESASVTTGSLVGDDILYYSDFTSITNVGSAENNFTITGDDTDNYEITQEKGTLSITKNTTDEKIVTITGNSGTKIYNGSSQSVSGFTHDASPEFTVALKSGKKAVATGTNAGTYNMGLKADMFNVSSTNYSNIKITVVDGTLTIAPDAVTEKEITITGNNDEKTYTGSSQSVTGFTHDGDANFTVSLKSGEKAEASGTNAGTYPMGLTADMFNVSSTNYSNIKITVVDGTLTITPDAVTEKEITITGNNDEKTYTGSSQSVTGFTHDGDASFTVALKSGKSAVASGTNAGSYTMGLTADMFNVSSTNYSNIKVTVEDGTLKIEPKNILIKGGSTVEDKYYDGTTATTTTLGSVDGIVDGDDVTITAVGTLVDANAGTDKTVNIVYTLSGADKDNYVEILGETKKITVSKAPITVTTPTVKDKEYDATTAAEIDGTLSFTGVQNNEGTSVINVTAVAKFEDVKVGDDKDVTVTYTLEGTGKDNYVLSSTTGTTTADITAKEITPSATGVDKEYDGTTTATVTSVSGRGILTGDDVTVTATSANFATASVGTNKTITVTYSLSGADASNYVLGTSTAITADITSAPITVTSVTASDKEYDGTTDATIGSVVFSGVQNSEGSSVINVTATASFADANVGKDKTVNIASYTLTGTGASNYQLATGAPTATEADITAKEVTITVDDKEKVYGATNPTFTGSVSGLINNSDLGTISYSRISTNENAGTYTNDLTASYTTNTNYNVSVTKGTFTIKPITDEITVTITGNSDEKTYSGSSQSVTGFTHDGDASFTVSLKEGKKAEASGTNAGTYAMGLTADMFNVSSTNYSNIKVTVEDGTLTITPDAVTEKEITITGNSDEKTYTGSPQSVTGFTHDGDASFTVSLKEGKKAEASGTNAGTYTMGLTSDMFNVSSTNYSNIKVTVEDGTLTITPKEVDDEAYTVTLSSGDSYEYNGLAQVPAVVVKVNGVEVSSTEYQVEYSNNKNVGEATITVTDAANGNYAFEEKSVVFTITPATITVNGSTASSKEYDGSTSATISAIDFEGVQNEESTSVINVVATTASFDNANVGTGKTVSVTYALSGTGASNYVLANNNGTTTGTITPKEVILSWGTTTFTYNGSVKTVTAVVTNKVGSETVNVATYSGNTETEAGKYIATALTLDNSNYKLPLNATQSWSIEKSETEKEITITGNNDIKIFNGSTQSVEGFTHDGDASFTVALKSGKSAIASGKNAGLYTMGLTADMFDVSSTNYSNIKVTIVDGKLTINSQTIDDDAYAISIDGDETFTYDGTSKEPKIVVKVGETEVDVVEYKVEYFSNINAGTATVKVSDVANGNYTFADKSINFTIEKATITVNGSIASSKEYDGLTLATISSIDFEGVQNEESTSVINVIATTAAFEDANAENDKTVNVTYALEGTGIPNYKLAATSGTTIANITAKEVELSWKPSPALFSYDGTVKTVTATVQNPVGSDVVTVTKYNNNTKTDAGEYVAEAIELSSSNYKLPANAKQTWSIAEGIFTVSLDDDTYTYDGIAHHNTKTASCTAIGGTTEYQYSFDKETWVSDLADLEQTNAGTYTINVKASNSKYKTDATCTASLIINKATITVEEVLVADKYYDGTKTAVVSDVTFSGNVSGQGSEIVTVTPSASFIDANVGTEKTVNVVYTLAGTGASNYVLASESGSTTADINAKNVVITVNSSYKTYGESDPTFTGSVDGLVQAGDLGTISYVRTNSSVSAADSYEKVINAIFDANANYDVKVEKGDFTINQKEVELVWSSTIEFDYDGSKHSVSVSVKAESLVGTDECSVEVYDNEQTAVGNYTATAIGLSNENYKLPSSGTQLSWAIVSSETAPVITWNIGELESYKYDGTEKTPAPSSIQVNDVDLIKDVDYTISYANNKNAGTATVTIKAKGGYSFDDVTKEFAIAKRIVTLTSDNGEKTYDGTALTNSTVFVGDDKFVDGEGATYSVTGTQTNAGSSQNTFTYELKEGTSALNYEISSIYGALNVLTYDEKYTITVNGNKATVPFTGEEQSISGYTISDYDATITLNGPEQTSVKATGSAVGSYNMGLKVEDFTATSSNYTNIEIVVKDGKLTISTKAIVVTATIDEDEIIYDGSEHKPTYTVVDGNEQVISPDEYIVEYSENTTDAGEVTVTISPKEGSSFDFEPIVETFTIEQKTVTLEWNSDSPFEFDNTEKSVSIKSVAGIVSGDECSIVLSGDKGTEVKEYEATASLSGKDKGNYKLASDNSSLAWEITTKELEKTNFTISGDEVVYNGESQDVSFTSDPELIEGTDYEVYYKIDGEWTTEAPSNAGEYEVKIEIINPNYSDEDIEGWTLVIQQKEVSLVWSKTTSFEYDGTAKSVTAELEDVLSGDDCKVVLSNNTNTAVGEYIATASLDGADKNNYIIKGSTSLAWEILISGDEYVITVTGNSATKVYNGSEQNVSGYTVSSYDASITFNGPAQDDAVAKGTTTGTYYMGLTKSDFSASSSIYSNITIKVVDGSLTISRKPLDVITATIEEGEIIYNGEEQEPSYILTDGDGNVLSPSEYEIVFNNNVNVGEADVIIKPTKNSQYNFKEFVEHFTISPKEIALKWSETTEFEYDGSEKSVTVEASGIISSDKCTTKVTDVTGVNAGDHTATVTLDGADKDNYKLPSNSTQSWTISKAPLYTIEVQGKSATKIYTGAEQSVKGYTYNPYDATITITESPSQEEIFAKGTSVGTYPTNMTEDMFTATSPNYETVKFEIKNGALTIKTNPVEVTATIAEDVITYNGSPQEPKFVVKDKDDNEIPESAYEVTYSNNTSTGEATATIRPKSDSPYNFEEITEYFTISPKEIELAWSETTEFEYDGMEKNVTVEATGIVSGDKCYVKVENAKATEVGTYTATATLEGSDKGNYVLPAVPSQPWSIEPKKLTESNFEISGENTVYDGQPQEVSFSSEPELEEGTDYEVYYKVDGEWTTEGPTNAGEYEVKLEITNPNYASTDIEGWTLTIEKGTQEKPVITSTPTSSEVAEDGKMIGLATTMEIRKEGETTYVPVTDENEDFANGTYYVRYAETDNLYASEDTKVVITPNVKEDLTTADFEFTAPSDLTYDGTEKEATFTTDKEGVGNIMVYYSNEGGSTWTTEKPVEAGDYIVKIEVEETEKYNGVTLTDPSWYFTIEKGEQSAPVVTGKPTSTPVTLDGKIDGLTTAMEIRKDGESEYIKYTKVTNPDMLLEPGIYYVRYAETDNLYASEETAVVIESAPKQDPVVADFEFSAPSDLTYDATEKEASVYTDEENIGDITIYYSNDGGETWTTDKPVEAGDYIVKIEVEENEFYNGISLADDDWNFTIEKGAQEKPDVAGQPTSTPTSSDGKIEGLTTAMEIRKEGETTYSQVTDPDADFEAGTYYVRYVETDNLNASEDVSVVINQAEKQNRLPEEYEVVIPAVEDLVYDGETKEVTVDGDGDIEIWYSGDGGETWTTDKPVDAGYYEVKIVVSEDDNYNSAELTDPSWNFTIEKGSQEKPFITTVPASSNVAEDGKMNELATTMEIRKDGESTYTPVIDVDMNFAVGTYYVRYAETKNLNASDETEVVITSTPKKTLDISDFMFNQPVELVYDGKEKEIEITTGLEGVGEMTIYYSTDGGETWTTDKPIDAGDYIVKVEIAESAEYEAITLTSDDWTFVISKGSQEVPEVSGIPTSKEDVADGKIKGLTTAMEVRKEGESTYTPVADPDMEFETGTYYVRYAETKNLKVSEETPVEIESGTKQTHTTEDYVVVLPSIEDLVYDGKSKEVTVDGEGDVVIWYSSDGGETWTTEKPVEAGDYEVKIVVAEDDDYYSAELTDPDWNFSIAKGSQDKPEVEGFPASSETAIDGKITGLTDGMEYRLVGETTYTPVTDPEIFVGVGTYYVRFAETNNLQASEDQEIVISVAPKNSLTELDFTFTVPDNLTYDGTEKEAKFSTDAEGVGDVIVYYSNDGGDSWTTDKPVNVGTYNIKIEVVESENYDETTLTDDSWMFAITKADQDAPEVFGIATSAPDMNDGMIKGLAAGMEVSNDNGETWINISDPTMAELIDWITNGNDTTMLDENMLFAPGEYLVRYAETENLNVSESTSVTIEEGTLPDIDMVDKDSFETDVDGFCPETDGEVKFVVNYGDPTEYRAIIKGIDTVALADAQYQALADDGKFNLYIPDCKAGLYVIEVQFRNDEGLESLVYQFDVTVNLSKKYITKIWDDVVSIINKVDLNDPTNMTKQFVEYQWYRNDEEIPGATLPYYNEEGGLQGEYYVTVVTTDGNELRTCSQEWHLIYGEITAKVYPNPVVTTATVELSADNGMEHIVEVNNIYGTSVYSTTFFGQKTTIDLQNLVAGDYVIVVDGYAVKVVKK